MTMTVTGNWATRVVRVDGRKLSPMRSQRVWNHSPDGFAWGYGGSGPAQLALALLLHAGLRPRRAVEFYQRFKFDVIARLPQTDFDITLDIDAWIARQSHGNPPSVLAP